MVVSQLVITTLCFAGLTVMYKVSQVRRCNSWVFLGGLYLVAGAISVTRATLQHVGLAAPPGIVAMGTLAGVASVLCLICVLAALRAGGKLSLVAIIGKMSISLPIAYSMIFLYEKLTPLRSVGIALFVLFVVLLNDPKTLERKAEGS